MNGLIPKVQHRIWIGPPMPVLYTNWLAEWKRLHPAWEHRIWGESNLPPLINQDLYDRAEQITTRPVWQYRSDLIRYELLYEHGGVYLDMDFEPVQALDPLMSGESWVCRHAKRYVGNAAMAFPPKHPAMAEAIERLPETAKLPASAPNTTRSGPVFFTPIAQRHGIKILPEHYFFPYDSTQLGRAGKVHGAYASHFFNNRRTLKGLPIEDPRR